MPARFALSTRTLVCRSTSFALRQPSLAPPSPSSPPPNFPMPVRRVRSTGARKPEEVAPDGRLQDDDALAQRGECARPTRLAEAGAQSVQAGHTRVGLWRARWRASRKEARGWKDATGNQGEHHRVLAEKPGMWRGGSGHKGALPKQNGRAASSIQAGRCKGMPREGWGREHALSPARLFALALKRPAVPDGAPRCYPPAKRCK